jgi:Protein of unknown function (DUF1566)/Calcium-binding EGF domain/EGF domain
MTGYRSRHPLVWALLACAIGACKASLPSGLYACEDGRCPPGQYCHRDGICRAELESDAGGDGSAGSEDGGTEAGPGTDDGSIDAGPTVADGGGREGGAAGGGGEDGGPTGAVEDSGAPPEVDGGRQITGDPDPCAENHGGCDPLAACTKVDERAVCGVCPTGYDDVAGDGTQCRDIDECGTDAHGCDATTQRCENLPGAHACPCLDGFHASGSACTLNVPCPQSSECATEASCQDVAGSRVCVCNPGYEGDGGACHDIDECARTPDLCGPNGTCTNTAGAHRCECVMGYRRESDACVDIDECAAGTDNCNADPDACKNDPGSFHCACPDGYTGTGRGAGSCANVDECASNPCGSGPHRCSDGVATYTCTCADGYTGTGSQLCSDANECSGQNVCTSDYPCANRTPGYVCTGQLAEWPMPDPQPGSINAPSYTRSSQDQVVTDNITRLSWQATPSSDAGCTPERTCNSDEARSYCANLELGGRDNWRLPTKIELESILDYSASPAVDIGAFPNLNGYIWTSSPCLARGDFWWLVDFTYGDVVCYAGSSAANLARALCVRGP